MPLVVETGAGVAGANSFVTVAEADAWYDALLDINWTPLSLEQKGRALVLGSAYVSNQQLYPFSGAKTFLGNALAWPRAGAVRWNGGVAPTATEVPVEVKQAVIVAAGLAAQDLLPTQSASVAGEPEVKRERVEGAITIDYYHSSEGRDSEAAGGVLGQGALAQYGNPDVTGLVLTLLREDVVMGQETTVVSRRFASRRGAIYHPDNTPPAFSRGMFDRVSFDEDLTYGNRGSGRGD